MAKATTTTTTKTTAQETATEATTTTEGAAQETAAKAAMTMETVAQEPTAEATTTTDTNAATQPDPEEKRYAVALWSIEHNGERHGCGDHIALTEAEFDSLSKGGVLGTVAWADLERPF